MMSRLTAEVRTIVEDQAGVLGIGLMADEVGLGKTTEAGLTGPSVWGWCVPGDHLMLPFQLREAWPAVVFGDPLALIPDAAPSRHATLPQGMGSGREAP